MRAELRREAVREPKPQAWNQPATVFGYEEDLPSPLPDEELE
jgi:hypothetical protein